MPLDPTAQVILQGLAAAGGPPLHEQTPAEARAAFAALASMGGPGADVASAVDREIAGVPCLVVTPLGDNSSRPVMVWIHGGGWVIGTARESEATARNLSALADCVVVSVDYRLAPEHPAPAAVDDCAAVVDWVLQNADELGGDAGAVAVGGDSAGGNLAALMALRFGHRLAFQALVYPVADLSLSHPSIEENAEGYLLTKAGMEWFVEHYLQGHIDPRDAAVSPLYATTDELATAAPAYVVTAEFDPLRDEGEAYAAALTAAGVAVTAERFDGLIHAFYGMTSVFPQAVAAQQRTAELFRAALT
ncbi:MAG: alpha/beta hydrolase [Ilumatobacteraceae bacterium]|jgi:acetyl esterase